MPEIEILPTDTGEANKSINLGRLEAGRTHDIAIDIKNGWKFPYELSEVASTTDMISVMEKPAVIPAGETGRALISVTIPQNIDRAFDGGLSIKGKFVIGGS